jgi:hypothetical protein
MSLPSASSVAVALAACAALAADAPARAEDPPPAAGGTLRVTADPPRLELTGDGGAELRVAAPPEVEDLSITASAGRIEGLRRLPGGGFAARYRPPAERVPQVAIVAAIARGGRGLEDGWVAIPMSGRGTARVRGDPGAAVSLRIGDRTFGPETAGLDGVAAIPVVVPPGIREGHQGYRPIDLHVPERSLLHAIADRSDVRADREERVRVVAYVVAPHGAARRGDAPAFEPSRGSVTVAEREAGAYVASWTLPPGPAGEERLVVRLPSAPVSRAVVRVEAAAGAPALVAVSVEREALLAGGEAAVVARALDAAGNPVPAKVELEARGAVLRDVAEARPGEVRARLSAGDRLQAQEAVVTATVAALGISGSRIVPLRPGEPVTARFEPRPVLRGDGAGEAILRVAVADRFGNPTPATPEVTAARGRVLRVSRAAPGEFEVRYVAPAVDRPVPEELVARTGAARAALAPVLVPPAPALRVDARAGAGVDLKTGAGRVGGAVGLERPADVDLALRGGFEAALRLEAGGVSAPNGARATLLAGPSLRSLAGGGTIWSGSATAGLLLGGGDVAAAGRLAVSAGLRRRGAEPFLELSILGATAGGAPGSFVAAALGVGVRLGVEGGHAHDPDRR